MDLKTEDQNTPTKTVWLVVEWDYDDCEFFVVAPTKVAAKSWIAQQSKRLRDNLSVHEVDWIE
jgi:hypothetical protein